MGDALVQVRAQLGLPGASSRCRHFHGIQNVCGAGINPLDVRDTSVRGMARWPCFAVAWARPCATICEQVSLLTDEEQAAEDREFAAACDKVIAGLAAGKCPDCGAGVDRREQVGKCVYARPCGHRLGQGRA